MMTVTMFEYLMSCTRCNVKVLYTVLSAAVPSSMLIYSTQYDVRYDTQYSVPDHLYQTKSPLAKRSFVTTVVAAVLEQEHRTSKKQEKNAIKGGKWRSGCMSKIAAEKHVRLQETSAVPEMTTADSPHPSTPHSNLLPHHVARQEVWQPLAPFSSSAAIKIAWITQMQATGQLARRKGKKENKKE